MKREVSPAGSTGEESKRPKGEKEQSQPPSAMDDELMRALQVRSSQPRPTFYTRICKIQISNSNFALFGP